MKIQKYVFFVVCVVFLCSAYALNKAWRRQSKERRQKYHQKKRVRQIRSAGDLLQVQVEQLADVGPLDLVERKKIWEVTQAEWKQAQAAAKLLPHYKKNIIKLLKKDLKIVLKEKLKDAKMRVKMIEERLKTM